MRAYTRNATSILSSELEEVDVAFLYGASAKWHFLMRLSIFRPASDNASHALL